MNSIFSDYIKRTIKSPDAKNCCIFSVFFALLLMVFAWFKGILPTYVMMMVPALIINGVIIFYGISQAAAKSCILGLVTLNLCAAMTQAVFDYSIRQWIFILIGVAVVLLFWWVTRIFKNQKIFLLAGCVICMAITLGLCFFMPYKNGTKAWLYINDKPVLQLTEVAKFAYVYFVGVIFSLKIKDVYKFVLPCLLTLASAIAFYAINEFGTLLIISAAFFCVIMTSRLKINYKALTLLFAVVAIGIACVGYFSAQKHMGSWKCPATECNVINYNTAKCNNCKEDKPTRTPSFFCSTCWYTCWEAKDTAVATACEPCKNDDFFKGVWGKFSRRVYVRGSVTYNYPLAKTAGITEHIDFAQQSIKVGRLFGDKDTIITRLQAHDTDSVIAALINHLGLVFAFVILIAFFAVFISVNNASSPLRIMAISTFSFQTLFTFCGTLNMMPLTGVGVPLISRGGSNLVVSYLLIYLMLTATRDQ